MHRRLTAVWMAAVLGITSCPLPAAAAMLPENANFEEEAQEEESFESFGYEDFRQRQTLVFCRKSWKTTNGRATKIARKITGLSLRSCLWQKTTV